MNAHDYDDIITSQERITFFLEMAFLEQEHLELQINRRVRLFFSQLLDHLPDPVKRLDQAGREVVVEPPYEPLSYLQRGEYFLVDPMVPTSGNILIGESHEVLLRFFNGLNALEFPTRFLGHARVRGRPAIRLAFPQQMGIIRKRRHYRAKVATDSVIRVRVSAMDVAPFEAKVVDVSVGGLSFINPLPLERMPVKRMISLLLKVPGKPHMEIDAFVRNHLLTAPAAGGAPDVAAGGGQSPPDPAGEGSVCGVQFDLLDRNLEMRISELVAAVQRDYLARLKEREALLRRANSTLQFKDPEGKGGEGAQDAPAPAPEPVEVVTDGNDADLPPWLQEMRSDGEVKIDPEADTVKGERAAALAREAEERRAGDDRRQPSDRRQEERRTRDTPADELTHGERRAGDERRSSRDRRSGRDRRKEGATLKGSWLKRLFGMGGGGQEAEQPVDPSIPLKGKKAELERLHKIKKSHKG